MEFYNKSRHTARKEHTCEMCGRTINVGEKYWRERGKYEGEFFERKLHDICHLFEREYCSEVDTEFNYYNVRDYIAETYCSECEHSDYKEDCEDWTACTTNIYDCPKIRSAISGNEILF